MSARIFVCLAIAALAAFAFGGSSLAHRSDRPMGIAVEGCSAAGVRAAVRSFAAAYSAGRAVSAAKLFAPQPDFRWFSAGPPGSRLGAKSYDRSTLVAYLAGRARRHERLRIVQLAGGLYDERNAAFNFAGKLIRTAADKSATARPQDFKGAAICLAGQPRFIVWSM